MITDDALAALRAVVGDRLSTAPSILDLHGRDESSLPPRPPDAVVFPATTAEVQGVVRACVAFGLPVVAWGIGSSLEGQALPTRGGVVVDTSRMDRILAIDDEDLDARVQPGVTKVGLNTALADRGLFFAVDPGADASIGGMAATGASGTMTVRYGTIRENVLALEVVTPDGEVVRTGSRARKSAAGYDLTKLFVGSEGTLGIITEIVVRLHGIPEHVAAAVVTFPTVRAAVDTAITTVQSGIPVARCELLDANTVRAVNAYHGLDRAAVPTLFLEFHGSPAGVAEQVEAVRAIAADNGGGAFDLATRAEDRSRLWKARHDAYFAQVASRPGSRSVTTDACVPVSRLAECIEATIADMGPLAVPAPIVGHVADGNFHCAVLVLPGEEAEYAAAKAFTGRLAERAIAMGGTCTGEHGVGLGKREYLERQYGASGVALMRTIKRALDPHGLFNPDKILIDEEH
jgi:D-lactate dehydrogenase (cytochrome)